MNLLHQWKRGWLVGLLVLVLVPLMAAVHAQNLDQGKSAPKLFADGCTTCHRSPRGLAKGRFSFMLSMFLKDHYTSGSDEASALASYLIAVDSASPPHAAKRAHPASGSRSSPRPPAPVPAH